MNVFTEAKKYQKVHPRTPWQQCIKAVSKKGVSGKKKKVTISIGAKKRDKYHKTEPGAHAARMQKAKKEMTTLMRKSAPKRKKFTIHGIAGVSMSRLNSELSHLQSLEYSVKAHQNLLKEKGHSLTEKAHIRREIAKYKQSIKDTKKHITSLKRSI